MRLVAGSKTKPTLGLASLEVWYLPLRNGLLACVLLCVCVCARVWESKFAESAMFWDVLGVYSDTCPWYAAPEWHRDFAAERKKQ